MHGLAACTYFLLQAIQAPAKGTSIIDRVYVRHREIHRQRTSVFMFKMGKIKISKSGDIKGTTR
jgi:hypothetical protein